MSSELSLDEIRHIQEKGMELQRGLASRARESGTLVFIHVPLPFKLPLDDGFHLGFDNDEARFLELVHYPYHPTEYVGEPILSETLEPTPMDDYVRAMRTVARFGAPLSLEALGDEGGVKAHPDFTDHLHKFPDRFEVKVNHSLGKLLDDGLVALNHLIRSYRVLEKESRIRPVDGKERLPSTLMFTVWDISKARDLQFGIQLRQRDDIKEIRRGLLMIHPQHPSLDQQAPDYQRIGKIVALTSGALAGHPHPFYTSIDLIQSASARLAEGDYGSSVIDAATGIEAYVHAFVRLDSEHQGVPPEKIKSKLETGFFNLIKDHFAYRLESGFDPDSPSNALDQWYSSAYKLRNKIVHEGYIAKRSEAEEAVKEASLFLTATYDSVMAKSDRFPEIAKLMS